MSTSTAVITTITDLANLVNEAALRELTAELRLPSTDANTTDPYPGATSTTP